MYWALQENTTLDPLSELLLCVAYKNNNQLWAVFFQFSRTPMKLHYIKSTFSPEIVDVFQLKDWVFVIFTNLCACTLVFFFQARHINYHDDLIFHSSQEECEHAVTWSSLIGLDWTRWAILLLNEGKKKKKKMSIMNPYDQAINKMHTEMWKYRKLQTSQIQWYWQFQSMSRVSPLSFVSATVLHRGHTLTKWKPWQLTHVLLVNLMQTRQPHTSTADLHRTFYNLLYK